ncbi:hypothetical protein GOBAR_DD35620 [Gossypium barbadense]|nr:hypothetical protein GOBAR_DD35620 [Gossypium barbadense]
MAARSFSLTPIIAPVLSNSYSKFPQKTGALKDTTYCNPKFVFPSQEESVDYVVSVVDRIGKEFKEKKVLFLVATYVVGKEKILVEVARRCKRKIFVDGRKMEILNVLGYGGDKVFTVDESESNVHVVGWNVLGETWPYFRPNFVRMKEIMEEKGYEKIVGFVPTGWTYEIKRNKFAVRSKDSIEIHLVPYSEHSNYDELREYVKFLKPKKVIPTVGMDIEKLDSKHADKLRRHFAGLVDEMANKKDFLMGFHRGNYGGVEKVEMDASPDLNEDKDMERKQNILEMKSVESKNADITLNDSSPVQKPDLQDSAIPSEEERERIIEELGDSLPRWVTRDQKLNLISSSRWNVVEAVSNFYEHENELYEQISAFRTSDSASAAQAGSSDNSVSSLNSGPFRSSSHEGLISHLSQASKPSNFKLSVRSNISPGKRKKSTENKSNKKVKSNSKLESSGSKQPMITSFFGKVLVDDSKGGGTGLKIEECPKDEITLPGDLTKSYTEKIDQFIQIINGNESSRNYVATLLEKTQGDINRALDTYYGNPEVNHDGNTENMVFSSKSAQVWSCSNDCPVSKNEHALEESRSTPDSSLQGQPVENVDVTLVSLPPDKYKPIEHACWRSDQPAPYVHLARTFDLVGSQRGKIKATSMLCNMFRRLELNIGGSLVTSALEEACGTNRSKIRDMYNDMGDLGSGSTMRKKNLIVNLIRSCREKEMKFLVRTLVILDFIYVIIWYPTVRNLRIGAMMKTVLPALAQAVVMNSSRALCHEGTADCLKEKLQVLLPKELSTAVTEAYNVLPNLDLLVPSLMKEGIAFSSSTLSMVPGIPIKPMLAKITNGVPEVLKLFQNKAFTCEYKYDGQRVQIHKLANGAVRVFSRNGDETTLRFPDLINTIKESAKPAAQTFILDAEVVAIDRKNGQKLMSFQELSSRERGSKDSLITVDKIKVNLFQSPSYQTLVSCLKDLFHDEKLGHFEYAKEIIVEADDACLTSEATFTINSFLEDALQFSCEGIMVKALDIDAGYLLSKRSDTWLKVKRDYVEGLSDSLDLVPIGAWHGNGRKAGWYSPFLMACYNPDTEDFQSVCRVMSGFSDSFYKETMSAVNITNVTVLDNPASFLSAFQFEISYECLTPLKDDLEWKLIYVGSAEDETYDQLLESVLVGPVNVGNYRFADPPDPSRIREEDIIGVTVLLLTCSYLGQEFIRVGYYVNNDYDDEQLREEPPPKVLIEKVQRNILSDKPRVTKFPINFHPENGGNEEPPPSDQPVENDGNEEVPASPNQNEEQDP